MWFLLLILTALACAVPLSSQTAVLADPVVQNDTLVWFTLRETKSQIAENLGRPSVVADFGSDYSSWQYRIDTNDSHEFSHYLTFRKSSGELISVTRNYENEENISALFPVSQSSLHHFPTKAASQYSLLLRRMPGDRILMAMGASHRQPRTTQLVIMRRADVRLFYPWLSEQIDE